MFPLKTVKFCKSGPSVEASSEALRLEAGQLGAVPPIVEARSQGVALSSAAELL